MAFAVFNIVPLNKAMFKQYILSACVLLIFSNCRQICDIQVNPYHRADFSDTRITGNPAEHAVKQFGLKEIVEAETEDVTTIILDSRRQIVVLTQANLPDDSVLAIRYELTYLKSNNVWELADVDRQHKCRRGPDRSQWTTKICL